MRACQGREIPWPRGALSRIHLIVFVIFLLHVVLVSPVFFPSMSSINAWDESVYINEGRELTHGKLPLFTMNPLVAALYALTYLPVHASPYWLIHSCSMGRVVFFGLLWWPVIWWQANWLRWPAPSSWSRCW